MAEVEGSPSAHVSIPHLGPWFMAMCLCNPRTSKTSVASDRGTLVILMD